MIARVAEIGTVRLPTVRGSRELSDAGSKTAALDAKTRELIALAVAVTRQCDGCITIHTDAALTHGVFSTRVLDAVDAESGKQPATA